MSGSLRGLLITEMNIGNIQADKSKACAMYSARFYLADFLGINADRLLCTKYRARWRCMFRVRARTNLLLAN
jgi:hypothetical protein